MKSLDYKKKQKNAAIVSNAWPLTLNQGAKAKMLRMWALIYSHGWKYKATMFLS